MIKKSILSILTLSVLIIFSCTESEDQSIQTNNLEQVQTRNAPIQIGVLGQDGNFVITENESDLATYWSHKISATGFVINSIEVRREVTGDPALMGYTLNGATLVYKLTTDGTNLFWTGGGLTTSCSGCTTIGDQSSTHCVPELVESTKLYKCSTCPTNDCVKTVSTTD